MHQLARRLPVLGCGSVALGCALLDLIRQVRLEQVWGKINLRLVEVRRQLLEVELGIESDLELWLEVVGAEVELDLGVLVAND